MTAAGEGDRLSASTRSGEAGGREWVNESTDIRPTDPANRLIANATIMDEQ